MFIGDARRHGSRRYLQIGMFVFLVVTIAVIWLAVGAPEAPSPNLPLDGTTIAPEQPLVIEGSFLRAALTAVTLVEVPTDDVSADAPRTVPVALLSLPSLSPWEAAGIRLDSPDGKSLLRPDASYRLTLGGNWTILALPWLRLGDWSTEYRFSTEPSPRPQLPDQPLYPKHERPVTVQWNLPVTGFDYRVSPSVDTSSAIDPTDPTRVYISFHGYVPGQEYRVEILGASGVNGIPLQRRYSFSVVTPKPPTPTLANRHALRFGEAMLLRWDEPIVDFAYRLDPPTRTSVAIDPADRRYASITLQHPYAQGQEYRLTITEATAENGTSLQQPYSVVLATHPALSAPETTPGDTAFGIDPDQPIGVMFSAPVGNRTAAEHAMKIDPPIDGRFEWPSDREMLFVPASPLPFQTEFTVRVAGGPLGPSDAFGGYLDRDVVFAFTTQPDKLIDVDLRRQVVTLWQDGQIVLTTPTSTGVRGAETPTGTFMVQYKMASTRMRGITPSGARYDIADVPWVLAFWGDFTIHGAYWRNGFGFPQSNGCVSLPVPIAKRVFEWAPEGTPIVIHY